MGRIQSRRGREALFAALLLAAAALPASSSSPLSGGPVVWYDRDDADIPAPAPRDPNLTWDAVETTVIGPASRVFHPVRNVRRLRGLFGGETAPRAGNVNALDEVPNGAWFTNRIGLFPIGPGEVAKGPCASGGPSRESKWTVVSAKSAGVTPGFHIRDARGHVYVIKFDPPGFLGMTTAAGIITNRLLWGAGYHVPEDGAVIFRREDLALGEGVTMKLPDGSKRPMTEGDIDGILKSVERLPSGEFLALSSRFLEGTPLGPFDWEGRRKDDPNDRIGHQHRRELRGLRVIAGWLNHFDTKQANTLDMYVEEDGRRFVRHHLIDFASTVGAGARGPEPLHGFEHGFDFGAVGRRLLTAGLHEDPWRRLERPAGLPEIGYFESYHFGAETYRPQFPNRAFANLTDRDGYWGAKIVTAFTDEHLRAVVGEAGFRDPEAEAYMVRVLGERRDVIGRRWFGRIPPLDFFRCENGVVAFRDLGEERGIFEEGLARYRARVAEADEERNLRSRSPWVEIPGTRVDMDGEAFRSPANPGGTPEPDRRPFHAVEVQVRRGGGGWSRSVTAYVARRPDRVVAVDR